MKYAAVAAALVGAVVADGWESWSTTSSWDPPTPTGWESWSSSTQEDPATWSTWSGNPPEPTTSPAGWESWSTTTSAECSYVTDVTSTKCWGGKCHPWVTKSTVYPTDCGATTWATWTAPEPTSTAVGWENWSSTTTASCSYVTDVTTSKCWGGKCHPWVTKSTVYPEDCSTTWATWTAPEQTTTASCSYVTDVTTSKCWGGKCHPWVTKSTVYPEDCATTWATWTAPEQTTTAPCSYVTEIATSKCIPGHPDQCWPYKTTETVYPTDCGATTWADWNTWTTPAPVVATSCSYVTDIPVTACWVGHDDHHQHCVVSTETSTVYPADCTTTAVWETTIIIVGETTITKTYYPWTTPAPVVATSTWAAWTSETPVVVTSVVSAGWEENGWFGPAWPVAGESQCVTNVVTSYGYPVWQPTPEASTVTLTSTWAQWTTTPVAPVVETTWATWTEKAVATSKPKPSKGKAPIAPNGNQWAMTYGPYDSTGACKTVEVIYADVKKIKEAGFTTIRVYSTDCNTLEYIGGACREYGLTIIIGVFISQTGIEGAKPQVAEIVAWAQWDIVELVVIGNEAVFQGFCQASELVEFITYCKTQFVASGYTGPCTTTEPLNEWQQSSSLYCGVVDVVSANLYAYFNSDCPAENAGEFIQSEIVILNGLCPGKETYVMECGWPSEGQCNGKACAGKKEQEVAITGIKTTCGAKIVFFSYEDEQWKQPGQFGVEQHWGVYDVFAGKGDNWSSWSKY